MKERMQKTSAFANQPYTQIPPKRSHRPRPVACKPSERQATLACLIRTSIGIQNRNRRMRNRMYGGVRGR